MKAITSAPQDLVVATCDAIDVRFAGVVFLNTVRGVDIKPGTPCVQFHLNGVNSAETMERDSQFIRDRQDWADRRKSGETDSETPAPQMPGVLLYERITIQITDDLGTEYHKAGGTVAGGETPWNATWVYLPAPPPGAQALRFEFRVDGGSTEKRCEVSI